MAAAYATRGLTRAGLRRNRVQFLVMHEVPRSEEERFLRLLERLRKAHRFISYSEAVDRIAAGAIDAPYLSLTFDDGFASCRRTAQVLHREGIRACFFLCPSIIGETSESRIRDFCRNRLNEERVRPFLSWRDVDAILADGHEIGGHTMTHANLAQCGGDQLPTEIGDCYRSLERAAGAVSHFCWPFGHFDHISPSAAQAVFDAGFRTCGSSERGCHVAALEGSLRELCLRRDYLLAGTPAWELEYFLARNAVRSSVEQNHWPFHASSEPVFSNHVPTTV